MRNIYEDPKLIGRYVKWLSPVISSISIGDYDIITGELKGRSCLYLKKYGALDYSRFLEKEIELMPENFDPNNINNEIQYEIC